MATRARPKPTAFLGLVVGLGLIAATTAALVPFRSHATRATPALALVLPVVVAAIVGGRLAAIVTAVCAAMAFNLAFIPPVWTAKINSVDDVVAFVVFLIVAAVVGTLEASQAVRRRAAEQRAVDVRIEMLERVDQQRTALLRSVSHDLRTPLATIRAATSDMRSGVAYDDATRNDLLDLVGDEAERLDRLVANLLNLTRIEAGALEPDRQAVALDELVAERVRHLDRLLGHARVEVAIPADLPLVDADYSQLDQVLSNLLENAARHAPAGSLVTVGARQRGGMVEVSVTDEGAGIEDAERSRVFEPFRRGPGSESSGVGLAICRAIVEAHGGTISADRGTYGGAVLRFTIPVRAVAQ